MQRQETTAVLCAIAGASLWGIVWLPLSHLEEAGVAGLWTTFLVFTLTGVAALPFVLLSRRKHRWTIPAGPALLLVLFGGLTNLLFFLALTETTVVRALMLFYLSPIWNLLAGRLVKGYPLSARKVAVVFISLSGAAILLGVHQVAQLTWNTGDSFALLSGICFAISVIGLQLCPQTPSWVLTVLHWLGAAATALVGIILLTPPPPSPTNIWTWLPFLLFFSFGIQASASLFILFSLTRLESYRVNILMLFEIMVGSISFALWSGTEVHANEWLGIGMILLASILDNLRPAAVKTAPLQEG